jgi:hypothetical protein
MERKRQSRKKEKKKEKKKCEKRKLSKLKEKNNIKTNYCLAFYDSLLLLLFYT